MPKTFKDYLPEKDYAGRLALGLVLLLLSQVMTLYEGVLFSVLRWVLFGAALANYANILFLYQKQKQEKINSRTKSQNQEDITKNKD
jgi:hypothetical protein